MTRAYVCMKISEYPPAPPPPPPPWARMSLGCSSKISCAVLVPEEFVISLRIPSKHVKSSHYRPASKTPSERRFADGPIVARDRILARHFICRGRPLNSFAVSRAANSIGPDQTEPTLRANLPAEDKTDKFYCN